MRKWINTFLGVSTIALSGVMLAGCDTEANIASRNLSTAAEQFEITRRIMFYNGITGDILHIIEGRCSIKADGLDKQLEVTCKRTADGTFTKDFLGLSDNVFYIVQQLQGVPVSVYHYRSIARPQQVIPDFDIKVNTSELFDIGVGGMVKAEREIARPEVETLIDR